jgi:hypothetical protein
VQFTPSGGTAYFRSTQTEKPAPKTDKREIDRQNSEKLGSPEELAAVLDRNVVGKARSADAASAATYSVAEDQPAMAIHYRMNQFTRKNLRSSPCQSPDRGGAYPDETRQPRWNSRRKAKHGTA